MLGLSLSLLERAAARKLLRRTGSGLGILLILVCMGCDRPGLDEGPGAIIGSWTFDRQAIETYLTVDEQQTILDPMQAGEGQLRLSGAEEAVLAYMRWSVASLLASGQPVSEFASDFRINGDTPVLRTSDGTLYVGQRQYTAVSGEEINVQRVGATLRMSADDVPFTGEGATVVVDGTLTGATKTLHVGEQEQVSTVNIEEQDPLTYRFEPDSTLLVVSAEGDTTRNRWRLERDRLVLVFGDGNRTRTYRFTYQLREDDMLLRIRLDCTGEGRSDCFGAPARVYGVDEETITAIEQQFELRFVPTEDDQPAARRGDAGRSRSPNGIYLGRKSVRDRG